MRLLVGSGYLIKLVVTQPDRPAGRHYRLSPPPIKVAATELALEIFQPERIRDPDAVKRITDVRPDFLVVAAYGQIIPASLLTLPRVGPLNVHASLLPRHRGPAPIPWTILEGDSETGVTIIRMDSGVDTGPILAQARVPMAADERTTFLEEKLANLGAELLVRTLDPLATGIVVSRPQPPSGVTYARRLTREDGRLNPAEMTAEEIDRRVRALNPEPGCWIRLGNADVKVLQGQIAARPWERGLPVETRLGTYLIYAVQPQGGKPMLVDAYLRGAR